MRNPTQKSKQSEMSHYGTLGLQQDANKEQIKKAYRRLALKFHPDKAGPGATAKFQQIQQAYETLNDDKKRKAYDSELNAGQQQNWRNGKRSTSLEEAIDIINSNPKADITPQKVLDTFDDFVKNRPESEQQFYKDHPPQVYKCGNTTIIVLTFPSKEAAMDYLSQLFGKDFGKLPDANRQDPSPTLEDAMSRSKALENSPSQQRALEDQPLKADRDTGPRLLDNVSTSGPQAGGGG
ncbi:MAG: J domain-containing protein [Coxiellaceae bacterium]|nr:J domain-containing protein [Coxiellaceae bacterium]